MKKAKTTIRYSYFVKISLAICFLTMLACEKWDFTPTDFFSIEISEIEKYTFRDYVLQSHLEIPPGATVEILQIGHCWSAEAQQPDLSHRFTIIDPNRFPGSGQPFGDTLTGLTLNTTYFVNGYFIANIKGEKDTVYSLTTQLIATENLLITTDENFELAKDSLIVRGLIRKPDDKTIIHQYGHCWSVTPDPVPDPDRHNFSSYTPTITADVLFETQIKTLDIGEQLYIRSYALIDGLPIMYGNTVQYSGTNRWNQLENMPAEPRGWSTSFVIRDRAYIGTGHARAIIGSNSGVMTCYNDFWSYDLKQNEWSYVGAFPGGERAGMISLTNGEQAYLGLGFSCESNIVRGKLNHFNDFYAFDPDNNGWRRLADYPGTSRSDPAGFIIGDTVYVGTGRVVVEPVDSFAVDFWKYSIKDNKWYSMPPLPGTARNGAYSFSLDGKGYVAGGDIAGIANAFSYQGTSDIYEYDPQLGEWKRLPFDLPQELAFGSAATLTQKGRAYFLSGMGPDFQILNEVLEFDPNSGVTSIAKIDDSLRILGTAFGYDGKLYITTGTTPQIAGLLSGQVSFLNDLWVFNF